METSPNASRMLLRVAALKAADSGSTSQRLHHAYRRYILFATKTLGLLMDLGYYGDQAGDINGSETSSNNGLGIQRMRDPTRWSHKWEGFDEWKRVRELVQVLPDADEES